MEMDRRQFLKGSTTSLIGLSTLGALSRVNVNANTHWPDLFSKANYSRNTLLRILYPQGCLANLQPVINQFEQLSGVKTELIEAGFATISNTMMKTSVLGKASDSYDIAIPGTFSIPDLVEAGVLANLNPLVKKFGNPSGEQSLYRQGDDYLGSLYGMQSSGDTYLLFLRKSWLENTDNQKRYEDTYGYKLAVPRHWQELDQQMEFFTDPDKGTYGGCMFRSEEYLHWEYWVRLHGQGSYPFDRAMEPLINSDAGIAALKQMKETTPFLHPSVKTSGPYENFSIFAEGNSYANLSWGGGQKFFNSPNSKIKDDLIVTQLPGVNLSGGITIPYFNWGWSYVLAANSQNKELAFLFMLLATSPEVSAEGIADRNGFFDPFLEQHFDYEPLESVYGRPYLDALETGLANAMPDLYISGYTQYFAALRSGLFASIYQNVPGKLSLDAVATKWRETTESYGIDSQISQWLQLQSKYPEALKAVLKGL